MRTPENDKRLLKLRNRHQGERCVIIANGPSLNTEDLELLGDEITIASNKIYLAFDETDWRPAYYTIADVLVAENNQEKIRQLDLTKICGCCTHEFLRDDPRAIFANPPTPEEKKMPFSWNLVDGVRVGHSVVNLSVKLAYWMGIKDMAVIGLDFSFIVPQTKADELSHGVEVVVHDGEQNHFHPDYRAPGERWAMPDMELQRQEFLAARRFLEAEGGSIKNASRKSKLDVWERVSLEEFLKK